MPRCRSRLVLLGALALVELGCRSVLGIEQTELDPKQCTLLTQRVFFADKPVSDATIEVGVLTQARFEELASGIGASLDPSRGHGLAEVVDCEDEVAEFAAADFDPMGEGATSFVVSGGELVLGTDTGVEGVLGALNLETSAELVATAYPDEIEVESSAGDIVARAGELSRIRLVPNSEVMVVPPAVDEWDCVGTIPVPVVSDPTITLTIDVQRSTAFVPGGVPMAGVRVAVCLEEPAGCDADAPAPDGSAVTDASGRAQLVVDTGEDGFDGHLVITGMDPSCL